MSASFDAWVIDGATLYGASAPDETSSRAPFSAVTELIQGIHRCRPETWRTILRQRIVTRVRPTPMCLAMVKVAAKRLRWDQGAEQPVIGDQVDVSGWALDGNGDSPVPVPESFPTDAAAMALARRLASEIPSGGARYLRDRPVAAVLVSADGRALGAATHRGSANRTLHAEVNLVQSWFRKTGRGLPPGARLFVTLKPCRMCAAMIWRCSEDIRSFQAFFGDFDPGPLARATALDLGSYDRELAAGADAELLNLRVQSQLDQTPCEPVVTRPGAQAAL